MLLVVVVHLRNITEALTFIAHSRILLLLYSFSSSFQPGKTVVIRALPRDFSERAFVAENADQDADVIVAQSIQRFAS